MWRSLIMSCARDRELVAATLRNDKAAAHRRLEQIWRITRSQLALRLMRACEC